jgi:hypothetical protein
MMMITTYTVYVVFSLFATIWVGHTLNRNGRVFLVDIFDGHEALADSINRLLLIGFYLVNIGFISLALRYGTKPTDVVEAIEFLSTKIGLAIVVLGFMHFFNMHMLVKFRRSRLFQALAPEQPAQA